jgi:hypothetical protein
MPAIDAIPDPFRTYCRQWSQDIQNLTSPNPQIEYFQEVLPDLLLDQPAWSSILGNIINGKPYPNIRGTAIFENEVLLYMDEARRFSIRIYLFDPGEYTMIHDHSAWGVSGTPAGRLGVIKYRLDEEDAEEGRARVSETNRIDLKPGQVDVTLPLDRGIHRTGNPLSEGTILMVSVYGKPMRRLYIRRFDPDTHQVTRVYPPKLRKKRAAKKALALL